MKKLTKLILIITMAVACFSFTAFASEGEIGVYVNSAELEFDVSPAIIEGRTMVPVRAIFEALGAEVEWEQSTKTVTATRDELTIKLTIGDKAIYVGGDKKELDVPALIIDGRTLVPARAVSEAFGADVQWNAKYREVYVNEYSDSYKELVSLIKEKGEKYSENEECYELQYVPSEKIVGSDDDRWGSAINFCIYYEENSYAPITLTIQSNDTYIFVMPDCAGKNFEYGTYSSEIYISGINKCDAITRDEDCAIEIEAAMDIPEEAQPAFDFLEGISAYLSYSELTMLQEWISSTGSDLTVEELGFVNYNKRTKPLAAGKDDKCDVCGKDAQLIPAILTKTFAFADIEIDGEYCVDHIDEVLIEAIDLDVVVKAANWILQLAQAESEEPVKYALATSENYVVMNLLIDEEYLMMLEQAARAEGYESVGQVLEEAFFADEATDALAEELAAFKEVLDGVDISFDGIIINICDSKGSVLADAVVKA